MRMNVIVIGLHLLQLFCFDNVWLGHTYPV